MPTGGGVRISLGIATNLADMQRFMEFATEFVDLTDVPSDLLRPRLACQVALVARGRRTGRRYGLTGLSPARSGPPRRRGAAPHAWMR
jgi:hypothetical protein